jgi:phytoene synthase
MGLPASVETEAACTASGYAYGFTRLLLDLPRTLRQGRVWLPAALIEASGLTMEEMLAGASDERCSTLLAQCSAQIRRSLVVARQFTSGLSRSTRLPFLPLALVEPYLRGLERSGRLLLREDRRIAPLSRISRIATAHLLGRV